MRDESRGKSATQEAPKDLPEWVKNDVEALRAEFDTAFYLAGNPDAAESDYDPLTHYCLSGWRELRDPSASFSTKFYLQSNPDVAESGVNPFAHFIVHGKAEGRLAQIVLVSSDPAHTAEIEQIRYHFDIDFYNKQAPDVAKRGTDPVAHYFFDGWRAGLDPTPDFSTTFYLQGNADIAETGINPYWHYIVAGKKEGRNAHPAQLLSGGADNKIADKSMGQSAAQEAPKYPPDSIGNDIEILRAEFDTAFYLARHPDVAAAGIDPLQHYLQYGWRGGLDPSPAFSTTFYLDVNPDIAEQGINPFWHYIVSGQHEGRAAQHPGGYKVERLRNTEPLEVATRQWLNNTGPGDLLNADQLEAMLNEACAAEHSRLVLSIGHDHYREVPGGVQLCAYREERLAPRFGAVYLNIHPWQSLPRLARIKDEPDSIVVLVLDGQDMGKCRMSDLILAVGVAMGDMQIVIHQLLGHLTERIAELIQAAGKEDCWLWLHDFFTICPSYTLQRNEVSYCAAPQPDSNACTLCRFGVERQSHLARMKTFFDTIKVHLLAPSTVTKEFWEGHSSLKAASIEVVPHVDLDWEKRTAVAPQEQDVITLAFLGTPASHKGWNMFEKLVHLHADDPRYRFVYFGTEAPNCSGFEHVPVHVTADDANAMIAAVADNQVDLVLHWASWPETFSLSTYEALAGAAYVITNPISGNVAASVQRLSCGAVLKDEADLEAFFTDGRVESMVKTLRTVRRSKQVTHQLNKLCYEVIGWEDTAPQAMNKRSEK